MNAVVDRIWVGKLSQEVYADAIINALLSMVGVLQVKPKLAEGWVEVEHEDFTDPESIEAKLVEVIYEIKNAPFLIDASETFERPIQWVL